MSDDEEAVSVVRSMTTTITTLLNRRKP